MLPNVRRNYNSEDNCSARSCCITYKQPFVCGDGEGVNKTFIPFVLGAFELRLVAAEVIPCIKRRKLYNVC